MVKVVTCTAPVNIAVIKYWGKRDERLILPVNDSISVTLSSEHMHAKTSVATSTDFKTDRLWLNGKEEAVETNQRLQNCLLQVRRRAKESPDTDQSLLDLKVHINSENNFPTAAGLASSAAGYACLVFALCKLYNVKGDISGLARQGSGSACRSVYGGFVRWHMGNLNDGTDSIATVVKDASHWPDMKCLILVANDAKKKVASSVGMKLSTETSEFLKFRAKEIVPDRTEQMKEAIEKKDFQTFARLSIVDSNSLHAVCLDTYPPCVYMNQVSNAIAELVHKINTLDKDNLKVAYTFDAGPNACLFLLEKDVPLVLALVLHHFPPNPEVEATYVRGNIIPTLPDISEELKTTISLPVMVPGNSLKYVISTGIGFGPEVLEDCHLLKQSDGLPVDASK